MNTSLARSIFSPVGFWLTALALLFFADPVLAQSSGQFDGGALKQAFCFFQESDLLKVIFAIALIVVVIAYMLDVVRDGFAALLLKWAMGIFFVMNIPMVLGWVGMDFAC